MVEKKSNKGLVIFLSMLVVVFAVISVLAFLGIFNKDTFIKTESKKETKKVETKKEETKKEEVKKTTGYYQYLNENDHNGEKLWNSREILFNEDGTAEYKYGGNASGGGHFEGTYLEDDKYIVFIGKNVMPDGEECDINNVSDYCDITIVFKKTSDGLVDNEVYYDGEKYVNATYEYKNITKEESRLLNVNYTSEH